MRRIARLVGLVAWSVVGAVAVVGVAHWERPRLFAGVSGGLDPGQVRFAASVMLLASWSVVTATWVLDIRRARSGRSLFAWHGWRSVLGIGTATIAVAAVPTPAQHQIAVPDMVAPAVAWEVLRRILERRRSQLLEPHRETGPRRLTSPEMETLSKIARAAGAPRAASVPNLEAQALPAEVGALLAAVEECEPITSMAPSADWTILVRLLGEPCVENRAGERAIFAKKRSLELLCWMVLNRDRSTRSAARTAMWDLDVADSTFSTIVSEMRRAVRHLDSREVPQFLSRPTYSDALPLSASVVTDVDLLDHAAKTAAANPMAIDAVAQVLSLVRDVPFAGAAYQWADLDGSTTRAIISVMRAVDMVISVGQQTDRGDLVLAGTRAGLRVMPGDERLLAIQKSMVTTFGS